MTPEAIFERAVTIADVRSNAAACKADVSRALVSTRQVRAWLDAQEAGLIRRLSEVDSFPEATIAETSKANLGQASKAKERADTLSSTPSLAGALEGGAITAGHIDVVTRAGKQLDEPNRERLLVVADELTGVAAAGNVEQFNARIRLEVKQLQSDDGEDRLTRQKRNTRLSTWTGDDGMWNLRGAFDPETGVRLFSAIDSTVATVFAEATPEHCPTDPIEKQKFLAAHAVARLIEGTSSSGADSDPDSSPVTSATGDSSLGTAKVRGPSLGATAAGGSSVVASAGGGSSLGAASSTVSGSGRASMIVVIDADAPDQVGPVAQWAIPVELPARVVAELAGTADVTAIVVRNGVVIHAPGNLELGRSTRLANRAQRRALRGLYRTCGIPGCSVGFDRCKIHHIMWWRHGGRTDLDNLIPVCTRHHTKIHDAGWLIELGPNRELTLRLPDGTVRNTGPPSIRAA